MNDYEAHLSSYDHTHRQRLKDMKAMVKDPGAGARARRAEAKADGIVSIKIPDTEGAPPTASSGFKKGGFKKSGFKSAFGAPAGAPAPETESEGRVETQTRGADESPGAGGSGPQGWASQGSDSEDEDYERYNPRRPTD